MRDLNSQTPLNIANKNGVRCATEFTLHWADSTSRKADNALFCRSKAVIPVSREVILNDRLRRKGVLKAMGMPRLLSRLVYWSPAWCSARRSPNLSLSHNLIPLGESRRERPGMLAEKKGLRMRAPPQVPFLQAQPTDLRSAPNPPALLKSGSN